MDYQMDKGVLPCTLIILHFEPYNEMVNSEKY